VLQFVHFGRFWTSGGRDLACAEEVCLANVAQWIHPSIHPSIHLFIHLSIYPPIHLSIYRSLHPSNHPSIHPGARGSAVGWGTVRFPMMSLKFSISGRTWGRLRLQRQWVPGIFSGGKDGRCVELTSLPPPCADCLEIWKPQSPGTLRNCIGL